MKKIITLFFFFLIALQISFAQKPTLPATRTVIPPKIDANLNDDAWKNVPVATNFITYTPEYGKPGSQNTEVKLIYDDVAIYVGVYMYDTEPSKIKKQLGARDDVGALADVFTVGLGTYDDGLNGYRLSVSASEKSVGKFVTGV